MVIKALPTILGCSDAQASHCGGLSCRGAQALGAWALVAAVRSSIAVAPRL